MIEFFLNLIDAFNQNAVKYMVIGGQAVNFYGYARSTNDLDIWAENNLENREKMVKAFIQLNYNADKCKEALDHYKTDHKITIYSKDNEIIEIFDYAIKKDYRFGDFYRNVNRSTVFEIDINFVAYEDLIKMKRDAGRKIDLLDIEELEEIRKLTEKKDQGGKGMLDEKDRNA